MAALQIKRIYQPAGKSDGKRILVDRLWPRGVSKEVAQLDEWLKAIAPSEALRKWFHQDSNRARWEEFKAKYLLELKQNPAVDELLDIINKNEKVTLLYAAHDEQHNHALVLLDFIEDMLKRE
jgi:uncharacterized protein YeaO (DUF488 family)